VEPSQVRPVVERFGRLVVGDGGELMVEFDRPEQAQGLQEALKDSFGDQVFLSP
jgi:hypothetical protein